MRVEHLDELAAERGLVLIDHRDRHVAQDLPQIGLRIVQPVEQRSEDHQTEHVAVGEDAPPFGGKRAGDSAAGRSDDRRLRMPSHRHPGEEAQAQPRQRQKDQRHRGEDRKRASRGVDRRSARRLVEQDAKIPAQWQDLAPKPRERLHADDREPDARIAEGR